MKATVGMVCLVLLTVIGACSLDRDAVLHSPDGVSALTIRSNGSGRFYTLSSDVGGGRVDVRINDAFGLGDQAYVCWGTDLVRIYQPNSTVVDRASGGVLQLFTELPRDSSGITTIMPLIKDGCSVYDFRTQRLLRE